MSTVQVRIDSPELSQLLSSTSGPVAQDLTRRLIRVQNKARSLAPVDTGNLRGSITWEIRKRGNQLYGIVGTNVPYAIYMEKGTRYIAPRPFLAPALSAAKY
jgi:HK97 gp10 family phage protein